MTDYTEQEVRKMARFAHVDGLPETVTEKMLTQFADMLAEREKAAPVAYRAEWNGDVSDEGAYVYCDADDRDFDHQWEPLYTHPAAQPRVPDGWMCNQAKIQELHTELQSRGWQLDSKGEPDCVDQASAMAAEVIERVLMPLLAAQESGR